MAANTKELCEDVFCSSQALLFGYLHVPVAVPPGNQSHDGLCFEAAHAEGASLTQVKINIMQYGEAITLIVMT